MSVSIGEERRVETRALRSRPIWIGGAVAMCLAVLLPFAWMFQLPASLLPRTLTDANGLVTVELPAGWRDVTGDARAIKRNESGAFYIQPDISGRTLDLDPASYLQVTIDLSPSEIADEIRHRQAVTRERKSLGVDVEVNTAPTPTGTISILSFYSSQPGEFANDYTSIVRTVRNDSYAVTIIGGVSQRTDGPAAQQLLDIVQGVRVD